VEERLACERERGARIRGKAREKVERCEEEERKAREEAEERL
jgi:hypothetical protein